MKLLKGSDNKNEGDEDVHEHEELQIVNIQSEDGNLNFFNYTYLKFAICRG
jgi:hypothetical protein